MEIPKQLREMFKIKKSNDYVNDNIRMYNKSNLKMYKNVYS